MDEPKTVELAAILDRAIRERWSALDLSHDKFNASIGSDGARLLAQRAPKLSALRCLNLNDAQAGGKDDTSWLTAIGRHLVSLEELELRTNYIGDDGIQTLAESARRWRRLRKLVMYDNEIAIDGAKALGKWLAQFADLRHLDVSYNRISRLGVKALVRAAGNWQALTHLILTHCGLDSDGLAALAQAGKCLSHLRVLSIYSNDIESAGAKHLAKGLAAWKELRELDIGNNHLSAIDAAHVCKALGKIRTLEKLRLTANDVSGRAMTELAKAMRHWPELAELDMTMCELKAKDVALLVGSCKYANKLQKLLLASNPIGAAGAHSIRDSAEGLGQLREINLSKVGMGDEGAKALIAASPRLTHLENIDLSRNGITDQGLGLILGAIERIPWNASLKRFYFEGNPAPAVPQEMAEEEDAEVWRAFVAERKRSGPVLLGLVKLLVLGEGRVGKTHLWRRLIHGRPFYFDAGEPQTHDFEAASWEVFTRINGKEIRIGVRAWDFGGQRDLHATHRLFLSDNRCLFLVVCDATRSRGENRLDYWLSLIRHEASAKAPIIVAITKCDLADDEGETDVERKLEQLQAKNLRAAVRLEGPLRVVDGIGWSDDTGSIAKGRALGHKRALRGLQREIAKVTASVPGLWNECPRSMVGVLDWVALEAFKTAQGASAKYIPAAAFYETCQRLKLPKELWNTALATTHSLGLTHYAGANRKLRRGEVLAETIFNPEWVRTPVYRIVTAGNQFDHVGLLSWDQIETILPCHQPNVAGATLWDCLAFSDEDRVRVIDLMVACELVFDVPRWQRAPLYFVPDHLTSRHPLEPPVGEHVWRRDFAWLPEAAFGRLLGRLHRQSGQAPRDLWRDQITVSLGAASVTVAWIVPASDGGAGTSASVYIAVNETGPQDAWRCVQVIDTELRGILGEPLLTHDQWQAVGDVRAGNDTGNDDILRGLWNEMTADQRHILSYLQRHEGNALTYTTLAENLVFPYLPGANVRDHSVGRTMSDKSLRDRCAPLFMAPYELLRREGQRGAIQLSPRGRRLLELMRHNPSATPPHSG